MFQLFDTDLQDGAELFSTMRESNLPPAAYLKRFVATGTEVGIDREEV